MVMTSPVMERNLLKTGEVATDCKNCFLMQNVPLDLVLGKFSITVMSLGGFQTQQIGREVPDVK